MKENSGARLLKKRFNRLEQKLIKAGGSPALSPQILGRFYELTNFDLDLMKALLEDSESLPPHPLEEKNLLYDRLLLWSSENYRSTRKMAEKMGFLLEPEVILNRRSYFQFDAFSNHFRYSPIQTELQWLTNHIDQFVSPLEQLGQTIQFGGSAYHDLNQMILARLLRPTNDIDSKVQQKNFHYFIESLTQMRDVDLSEELGDCRVHLTRVGSIYSSPNIGQPKESARSSWRIFRSGFYAFYMVTREGSKSGIDAAAKLFLKNHLEWLPHPFFEASPLFADQVVPTWMKLQKGQFLPKKFPPRVPSEFRSRIFKFRLASAEKMAKDQLFFQDLFQWFQEIFPRSGIKNYL